MYGDPLEDRIILTCKMLCLLRTNSPFFWKCYSPIENAKIRLYLTKFIDSADILRVSIIIYTVNYKIKIKLQLLILLTCFQDKVVGLVYIYIYLDQISGAFDTG